MVKRYLNGILCLFLAVCIFPSQDSFAQDCSTLTANYISAESRCASTGSIQVNASGGSGNYQYKVSGPVTINFTSSSLITGLGPGKYLVIVKDVTTNCVYQQDSVTVAGSYQDPGFTMVNTDVTCLNADNGTISVNSQSFGRAPFSYTIIAPSASHIGSVSATGNFTGLSAGNYFVQLTDSCGAIQTRSIAILDYDWLINNHTVTRIDCNNISVTVNLKDSRNNMSPNAIFNSFSYGVSTTTGDTTWYSTNTFAHNIGTKHSAVIFAKDGCGNIKKFTWNDSSIPAIGSAISVTNKSCSTFTAQVTGKTNLTNPQFCLYDNNNILVSCNTTGTFTSVPYGNYCIKTTDACYDTTITRCFSVVAPVPAIAATVSVTNQDCSTFTAQVTGQVNLNGADFCLYDNSNVLISCNATGLFNGIPYGSYCIKVTDGCYDTTITRCFTAVPPVPSVNPNVATVSVVCTDFTATITGQMNLSNPTFCLYDNNDVLITCNATGVFPGIGFGTYCIKIANDPACYDTTITRCFTAVQPLPHLAIAPTISNKVCETFTVQIADTSDWSNPQFCLYTTTHVLIACNATGNFDNVPYADYCIEVANGPGCYDTTMVRCFTVERPFPDVDQPVISDRTCSTFTVTITGQNISNGQYCLYDSAHVAIECNSTGVFSNVMYGQYCVELANSPLCYDTTITRCFRVDRPAPAVDAVVAISNRTCGTFTASVTGKTNVDNAQFCLYNSNDSLIICDTTGVFQNIPYGSYCIKIQSDLTCYDTLITRCFAEAGTAPFVNNNVSISNRACGTFTATVTGQAYLSNEQYCLFTDAHVSIECNSTGIFDNVPYGSYCIEIANGSGCYDTTITRCFSASGPVPGINNTVSISNRNCTGFTATITGKSNLSNEQYCLYDNVDTLISCNSTGIFTNVLYGSYCIRVANGTGCYDTTITRCFTVNPVSVNIVLSAKKSCDLIGGTNIKVTFSSGTAPYTIHLYSPTDVLLQTKITSSSSYTFYGLAALDATLQYKIVVTDQCGNQDIATVTPVISTFNTTVSFTPKCPSGVWANGSSDIKLKVTSNIGGDYIPKIIKKDGVSVSINVSTTSGTTYNFLDMGPATYVIDTYIDNCNEHVYDTVIVNPYTYPNLSRSAAYQCDNNSFSVGAAVSGGIGPFQYEIIGSLPASPSIIAGPQSGPVFSINNGTAYSLIRLRATDVCSNAGLNDASVLPLANTIITADATCFYQNITLSVDTIANALYKWYKRVEPNDSILIDTTSSYNIPYLLPTDTGRYLCKVIVNNGCLERLAQYTLTGYCGGIVPVAVSLQATKVQNGNLLKWENTNPVNTKTYFLERSTNNIDYKAITEKPANLIPGNRELLTYLDQATLTGNNYYRVRIVDIDNSIKYSNIVRIKNEKSNMSFYPNPVNAKLNLVFNNTVAKSYLVELKNMQGQKVFVRTYPSIQNETVTYPRSIVTQRGVYILTVTDLTNNERETYKIIFE